MDNLDTKKNNTTNTKQKINSFRQDKLSTKTGRITRCSGRRSISGS
jgi:hypothetical protein